MWRGLLVRLGFAATGILYMALGITAARVALAGSRGRASGMPEAFRLLLRQPHGRTLLAAVACGLAAFALWHLLEAGRARGKPFERMGHLFGTLGYAALTWTAVSLLLRLRHTGPPLERTALGWLLSRSWGVIALEVAGALTIGAGLFEILQGISGRLRNRFATQWLSRDAARLAKRVARFGLAARGLVLVMIGLFQLKVAADLDPRELTEIGGALRALSRAPVGGPLLVAVTALGLVSYGLYMEFLAVAGRRN